MGNRHMSEPQTVRSGEAKPGAGGLFILAVVAAAGLVVSLYLGKATLTTYAEDWIDWARISPRYAGAAGLCAVLVVIGLLGSILRLLNGGGSQRRADTPARAMAATAMPEMMAAPASDARLDVPEAGALEAMRAAGTEIRELRAQQSVAEPEALPFEPASLEPRIFHDNASDSFLSQNAPLRAVTDAAFDPSAALSEAHGLQFGASSVQTPLANVVPLRPSAPEPHADPLAAALLADTPEPPAREAPVSDIQAVISSAMKFIETPADVSLVAELPVVEAIATPAPVSIVAPEEPVIDPDEEIRQAVQMALSVWPDSTRGLVAEEIRSRVSRLYYDKSAETQAAFHQIASGELNGAAAGLMAYADRLAMTGSPRMSADVWRVIGALYMGRNDDKALEAYEKVSENDADDANIHLYLARRFLMSGDHSRLPAVAARALKVIGDPAIRLELLAPYADQLVKTGDMAAAVGPLEELAQFKDNDVKARPEDVSASSAHAIALARLAQAREVLGQPDKAGALYRQAHTVFAGLSARMPEHAGLKAMADNALRDAQRLMA